MIWNVGWAMEKSSGCDFVVIRNWIETTEWKCIHCSSQKRKGKTQWKNKLNCVRAIGCRVQVSYAMLSYPIFFSIHKKTFPQFEKNAAFFSLSEGFNSSLIYDVNEEREKKISVSDSYEMNNCALGTAFW